MPSGDVLICNLSRDHHELLTLIGEATLLRNHLGNTNTKKKKSLWRTLNLIIHVRDADPHKVDHNHFVSATLAALRAALADVKKDRPPTGKSAEQAYLAGEAAVLREQIPRQVGNLAGNIAGAVPHEFELARGELHRVVHAERGGLRSKAKVRASVSAAKEEVPFIALGEPEMHTTSPLQPALLKVFAAKEDLAPWGFTQIHVPCRAVLATNVHSAPVAVRADEGLQSQPLIISPGETTQVGWAKRSDRWDGEEIDEGLWELFPRSPLSSSVSERRGCAPPVMQLCVLPIVCRGSSDRIYYHHDPRAVHFEIWQLQLKRLSTIVPSIVPIFSSELQIERVQLANLSPTREQAGIQSEGHPPDGAEATETSR